ncbi:QWRF motif-containing protein 3-like [Bidens hawaiensis]|uniref:QWRF motif-containing protein 3-like n=1 Tax=Bidens hawaiensis TaxID=980011 RepID=UPI0040490342
MTISGYHTLKCRYLSPISAAEPPPWLPPSPNKNHNALSNDYLIKPRSSSFRNNGLVRGVWPSSTSNSILKSDHSPAAAGGGGVVTLADYLGSDRKRDSVGSSFLRKQRSCSEFNRFESDVKKENNNNLKENHKPGIKGGSMRYTGKFRFIGRSSASKSSSAYGTMEELDITPGRLSVDENELRRRTYSRMRSGSFTDDSECSDMGPPFITNQNSPASYMAPTIRSRKSISNSPTKSTIKNAMKKSNALSLSSKWGSSSGQPESPPMTANSPLLSSKPPTSPSRTGKRNILHMGLDLIRSKKTGSGCSSPLGAGVGMVENVHRLRMMHGSWMQWRYANARANAINEALDNKAKNDLFQAWKSVAMLQQSVLQKRLQMEKEKLEIKLNTIFHSQMKMLEAWKDMERRHTSDISMTKDCLEAIACRVPLIEGAKTSETASILSELAKVAIEETSLLEECSEHLRVISTSEIEERSLRCSIMEMTFFEAQGLQEEEIDIVMQRNE